ncbi:MAG: argininosuccinate lyase [Planctomycetes bacterium]|nr:argininosuccinate lyase [Planctomycetota bacterium]
MARLWDKGEGTDELVLAFCTGSDPELDARLVPYDVRASVAHVHMLARMGHVSNDDAARVEAAFTEIAQAHADGQWQISRDEEDVHTALENRLVERLGDLGKRVHLGRSRNDQVLAALRLYLDDVIGDLDAGAGSVTAALTVIETGQGQLPLPGYTHLQRAMPSSIGLWAGGFRAEIEDDREGLRAARRRVSKNPLGSAAGYGVPDFLRLDREDTRRELGFRDVQSPVTAVQLSRGKAEAGVAFECALLQQDLGRLAADLVLYTSAEFAFVSLPRAFTTGSSIMPQKRNPDVFELVRGRSAQAPADLQAVMAVTQKMTSGYHRDFQLTKEPLFRTIDRSLESLAVMARALPGLVFQEDALRAAMTPDLEATERALKLVVEAGLPFREAYQRVAKEWSERP